MALASLVAVVSIIIRRIIKIFERETVVMVTACKLTELRLSGSRTDSSLSQLHAACRIAVFSDRHTPSKHKYWKRKGIDAIPVTSRKTTQAQYNYRQRTTDLFFAFFSDSLFNLSNNFYLPPNDAIKIIPSAISVSKKKSKRVNFHLNSIFFFTFRENK